MKATYGLLVGLIPLSLCCVSSAGMAQQPIQDRSPAPTPGIQVETIAVLPWTFQHGAKGAVAAARSFRDTVLTRMGISKEDSGRAVDAYQEANGSPYSVRRLTLPSPVKMLRTGEKLGCDWVMAAILRWHSRSIWVGFGPKTKSTAYLDMRVVDVKKRELALDVAGLKMDDTAKDNVLEDLGTVFVSSLFTVVSGGPRTPHEQRAAELVIAKAMQPWVQEDTRRKKIGPDPAAIR